MSRWVIRSITPEDPSADAKAIALLALSRFSKSAVLYEEARRWIPSGASSNMRVYAHEPFPIFLAKGRGSRVWDADGNEYIDYLLAYGSLILGHCHPRIVQAIKEQLEYGTMLGTPTELEVQVAKKIASMVPCAEMVSFANTGTEATMEAIRIARAYTGKDKILKFEGHYHGHHDYVLFSVASPQEVAGLESAPHRLPYYPGIPEEVAHTVLVAPWNNPTAVERILKKHASDIAAVIAEPVMGNAGVIPPDGDFLRQLKELAQRYDTLLIFDEVLTGFRLAKGGAQEYYGVEPDLACFAKALGGGMPIAAVAGRQDIMGMIGPGKIGYGGTYNANPISLAACRAVLEELTADDGAALRRLNNLGNKLMEKLQEALDATDHSGIVQGVGSLLQVYFTRQRKIASYRHTLKCNHGKYKEFRDAMLKKGICFHPDGGERLTLSVAHTYLDIERTAAAAEEVLRELPR